MKVNVVVHNLFTRGQPALRFPRVPWTSRYQTDLLKPQGFNICLIFWGQRGVWSNCCLCLQLIRHTGTWRSWRWASPSLSPGSLEPARLKTPSLFSGEGGEGLVFQRTWRRQIWENYPCFHVCVIIVMWPVLGAYIHNQFWYHRFSFDLICDFNYQLVCIINWLFCPEKVGKWLKGLF